MLFWFDIKFEKGGPDFHKVIWLADACVSAATGNASEATQRTHNSVQQHLTSLHSE